MLKILRYDKNNYLLFTTDMLVENDHFSLKYFTPRQIGMKSIEQNVSDIAAMGGIPKWAVVSLGAPAGLRVDFIKDAAVHTYRRLPYTRPL